jgi:glycosyltransferase involved in cell wall biosynthesis
MSAPLPRAVSRLVMVQFGDFAAAERRLTEGGHEDYYAQRYTVEYVKGLARRGVEVFVIYAGKDVRLERLPSGVASMGIEIYPGQGRPRVGRLLDAISAWRPTHIVLATPLAPAIWWAVRNGVRVLPLFADSFGATDPKSRIRHFYLAATLNHPDVRWVVNHGVNAARDLVRIGVPKQKVLAFDWPAVVRPQDFAPKTAPESAESTRMLFVGQLLELKGIGDCIAALRFLSPNHRLTVVGKGDQSPFERLARELGLADRITFLGAVPHPEVLRLMHAHDVVVVPSRHQYPEGLPMTIYEGLCSRTPIVVSDHPMFRSKIVDGQNGVMFSAGDPEGLARAVLRLVNDRALYERLSLEAESTGNAFFSAPKWHEIIDHWLTGSSEDEAWLGSKTLASLS